MKVRIDYSDGQYSMTPIDLLMPVKDITTRRDSEYRSFLESIAIEIPDADSRRFERFLKVKGRWQQYMRELDNKQQIAMAEDNDAD